MKTVIRADGGYIPMPVWSYCMKVLSKIDGLGIMTVCKPSDKKKSVISLYEQQIHALDLVKADYAFSAETDVLYHPSRFIFEPLEDDLFYYQCNLYELTPYGFWKHPRGHGYCQMVANCQTWKENLKARISALQAGWRMGWAEPGLADPPEIQTGKVRISKYYSEFPDVSIRHGGNISGSRDPGRNGRTIEMYVSDIPYWGNYKTLLEKMEIAPAEGGV